MVIEMNKNPLSDHTGRYKDTGLFPAFLEDMATVISALEATGYEPYDQLTGYVRTSNERYITHFGGARDTILKIDVKGIKTFMKHYKDHK